MVVGATSRATEIGAKRVFVPLLQLLLPHRPYLVFRAG